MSSYVLMHSGETYYNGKRKSNKKDFMYKTFTETSSIGLKGESKTIKYYKEDELFHCFDGETTFTVDREGAIDRKVKSDHRKGLWGDNDSFNSISISHSAKGEIWKHHKYIAIKNGRYIYPEDLKKQDATSFYGNTSTNLSKTLNNKTGGTFTALKFKKT